MFTPDSPALLKLAKVLTPLKPHQQRLVDRLMDPSTPGLVAVHGLGSGKTLSSLAAADALGMPTDVVTPAALTANYEKELEKHTPEDARPEMRFHTQEAIARNRGAGLEAPVLVLDEAHRMRNAGALASALSKAQAKKRLALSASPVFNDASDIARPINFVAGKQVLPTDPDEFRARYLREVAKPRRIVDILQGKPAETHLQLTPAANKELKQAFKKYVDYYSVGDSADFPTRRDEVISVPMTQRQQRLYDKVLLDMPPALRRKILMNLPPSKADAAALNSFMSGVRQVANTSGTFDAAATPEMPKLVRAATELQKALDANERAKAVVYSNYLGSGLTPYAKLLEQRHIPYGVFTGELSPKARNQMVRDYNDNKLRALLLSGAGSEGLDLKGTRLMQILEPHWNEERQKQVIGRGVRYQSHAGLPEDERNVHVQRFLASRADNRGTSVDEYLYGLSQKKEEASKLIHQLMRDSAAR